MNQLHRYIVIFSFIVLCSTRVKSQDVPLLQMSVGAATNLSLFSNKINNGGGYLSLEYLVNRNIFIGLQADYLIGQNKVNITTPTFGNAVVFPGKASEMKENISKLNTGIYAGYKFFPLNNVSFNVAASASNISLNRKFKDNVLLNEEAITWYSDNWYTNSAVVFGVSGSIDFYLNKSTMFRAGVNYQDITNALFNQRDQRMVKEISYTDGKISSMVMHPKLYGTTDVFIALVFKLGLKKL